MVHKGSANLCKFGEKMTFFEVKLVYGVAFLMIYISHSVGVETVDP